MSTTVIMFSRHGPFLGTRHVGKQVQSEIVASLEGGHSVVLDFTDVNGVTQSFADECIGKLLVRLGKTEFRQRVRFRGVSPTIKPILHHVTSQRAESLDSIQHKYAV